MEIKDILKQRRLELSLTMADVAKAVGVSEATVCRWESGYISNMRQNRIAELAKVLQLKPSVIMGWEEQEAFTEYNPFVNEKIKFLLKARNISVETFATELKQNHLPSLDLNTVKKWCDGYLSPTAEQINAIANYFGVPTFYFLDNENKKDKKEVIQKLVNTAYPLPVEQIEVLISLAETLKIQSDNKL